MFKTYITGIINKYLQKRGFPEYYSFHDVIVMSPHYKSNSNVSATIVLTNFILKNVNKVLISYHLVVLYLKNGVFWYIVAPMMSL